MRACGEGVEGGEGPQGYSHLGCAVSASYRTLQNKLMNN